VSTATKRGFSVFADDTNRWRVVQSDAMTLLRALPDACVDAVLCDPPYAISIAGQPWDRFREDDLSTGEAFERWTSRWASECRRVLKPGGHLLAFGAPRTFHRLVAGVEDSGLEVRDQLLWLFAQGLPKSRRLPGGLGTTLKPTYEPILLARSPIAGGTLENLERYGTGALNIAATRIPDAGRREGYWPTHIALAHTDECTNEACAPGCAVADVAKAGRGTELSRLFFCAKASTSEREAGCDQLPLRPTGLYQGRGAKARSRRNSHPTVKPAALLTWLVRLSTPPGGIVLDPFCGSGSTGIAAVLEGRRFLGVEREASYVDIACARLTHWAAKAAQEKRLP
jgi:site-specific DNA-methyltransferase (adenine-specific)